jgi:uncharacterized protein
VHVSAMSTKFISDPREVVKSGAVVKVKVMEVDPARKRISLTLRLDDEPGSKAPGGNTRNAGGRDQNRSRPQPQQRTQPQQPRRPEPAPARGSLADALRRAGFGK